MTETWEHFYQPPWPNRAEAAVRILKAQLKIMLNLIKSGNAPATLKKVSSHSDEDLQILIQLDVATPTQLTIDRNEEELAAIQIKQAFQEARQSEDIRRDLAQKSSKPLPVKDKVFPGRKASPRFVPMEAREEYDSKEKSFP